MQNTLSKLREKRAKDDKGFTLIELLVVVVILGVLIAIAIPLYLNYRRGARDASSQSDLRNAISVLELCQTDNGRYPSEEKMDREASGQAGACKRDLPLSQGTRIAYRSTDKGVTYTITATNESGSGKIYCFNSAVGGQVAATGSELGAESCGGGEKG